MLFHKTGYQLILPTLQVKQFFLTICFNYTNHEKTVKQNEKYVDHNY